jgi:hypothetical protein
MRFTFATRGACCGNKTGGVKLRSTNYAVAAGSAQLSLTRAFDVFYTNYHTQPIEIVLTQPELVIIQAELPNSEFSLTEDVLHFRGYPISVEPL